MLRDPRAPAPPPASSLFTAQIRKTPPRSLHTPARPPPPPRPTNNPHRSSLRHKACVAMFGILIFRRKSRSRTGSYGLDGSRPPLREACRRLPGAHLRSVIANRIVYRFHAPKRGDIVVSMRRPSPSACNQRACSSSGSSDCPARSLHAQRRRFYQRDRIRRTSPLAAVAQTSARTPRRSSSSATTPVSLRRWGTVPRRSIIGSRR